MFRSEKEVNTSNLKVQVLKNHVQIQIWFQIKYEKQGFSFHEMLIGEGE